MNGFSARERSSLHQKVLLTPELGPDLGHIGWASRGRGRGGARWRTGDIGGWHEGASDRAERGSDRPSLRWQEGLRAAASPGREALSGALSQGQGSQVGGLWLLARSTLL
jgi:hypothetical protein